MKKFMSLLAVLLCFAMFAMPFSSYAAAKDDVIAALEEAIPEKYPLYLNQAKNLLAQVDVSDEQAEQLIAIIDELKEELTDHGASLDKYPEKERQFFLEKFYEGVDILGLTYTFEEKAKPEHKEDIVCYIYDADGKLLIKLDGDVTADKTDVADNGTVYLVLAGVFMALSVAAFVFTRKRVSAR